MTFGKQRRTSKDFPFVSGMRIMVKTRATPTMTPYIQKTRPAPRLFRRSRKVLVTRNVPAQLVPVAREAPRLLDLLGSSSPISSQGIGPNLGEIKLFRIPAWHFLSTLTLWRRTLCRWWERRGAWGRRRMRTESGSRERRGWQSCQHWRYRAGSSWSGMKWNPYLTL